MKVKGKAPVSILHSHNLQTILLNFLGRPPLPQSMISGDLIKFIQQISVFMFLITGQHPPQRVRLYILRVSLGLYQLPWEREERSALSASGSPEHSEPLSSNQLLKELGHEKSSSTSQLWHRLSSSASLLILKGGSGFKPMGHPMF